MAEREIEEVEEGVGVLLGEAVLELDADSEIEGVAVLDGETDLLAVGVFDGITS